MPDVVLDHTDYAFALDVLEATGFDLHFPATSDVADPEFLRIVEHRDRSAAKLAAIIARVRRGRPAVATAQHHVFATRLCEALGIKPDPERVKTLARLGAEVHEVAVSCAVVRVESLFDIRERSSKPSAATTKKIARKKGTT